MKRFLLFVLLSELTFYAGAQCTGVTITTQPSDYTAAQGYAVTFTIGVSGTAPFSYFWYKNGTLVGNSSSYTTPAVTSADNGSTVYCRVTNCNSTDGALSRTATLSVTSCTPVTIASQPPDLTAIEGAQVTFNFSVNGTAPFTYFWYKNNSQVATTNVPSYTLPNPVTAADNGSIYYCNVNNCANQGGATTRTAILTVNTCTPVQVTSQPSDVAVNAGSTATFSVSVSGTAPFSYNWYKNGNFLEQTQNSSYTTPVLTAADNNSTYFCQVTNCANLNAAQTRTATLTINAACTPVSIVNQPQPIAVYPGSNATFSVSVNGTAPFSYAWFKDGQQISGAISSTYGRLNISAADLGNYNCQVTNCNNGFTATSNPAALSLKTFVNPLPTPQNVIGPFNHQATTAEPIQLGTGSYFYKHDDLKLKTVNGALIFSRYYNSLNAAVNGPLGYGWSGSYYYRLTITDTLWTLQYPDGHLAAFIPLNNVTGQSFPVYTGTTDSLNENAGGDFTLRTRDNLNYHFTPAGLPDQITDMNGNITSLTYSGNNVVTITGPGGRAFNLAYNGNLVSSVTDPLNRMCSFSYDSNNNLINVLDPNGGTTRFTYDGSHRILTIVDAVGNPLLQNTYDNQGRVVQQHDAAAQVTAIAYNTPSNGDVTVTNPDNSKMIVHHDTSFRKTYVQDELGFIKTYTYDAYNNENGFTDENGHQELKIFDHLGNLLTLTKPGDLVTKTNYNQFNSPLQITDPNGNVTSYIYDAADNLTSVNYPDQATQYFTYNPNGLKQTSKDARGNVTNYTYSASGDLLSFAAPNGTRSFQYDNAGRVVIAVDENGNTITTQYDNNDNVLMVNYPYSYTKSYTYNANNQVSSFTDFNGNTTQFSYDQKGRLLSKTDANNGITKYAYDVMDNRGTITAPNGNKSSFQYDAKRRQIAADDGIGTTQSQYDPAGNLLQVTDPTGKTKTYTYTPVNQIQTKADGMNNVTTFSYDAVGNLTVIADALSQNTSYAYDQRNRLLSTTDAAGGVTKVVYDANGNKKSVTDPLGHTITYSYDAANRISGIIDAAGDSYTNAYDAVGNNIGVTTSSGTLIRQFNGLNEPFGLTVSNGNAYGYSYDKDGNLASISTGAIFSYFNYDKLNHLTSYNDGFNNKLTYTYDASGNKLTATYPGNQTVKYTYDVANHLKTVTDWLGHQFSYSYDASGKIIQLSYPNGINCTYTYDQAARLTNKKYTKNQTVFASYSLSLDATGNRISEQVQGPVAANLKPLIDGYVYEKDDRLLKDSTWAYVNDNNGNRSSQTKGKTSETFSFTADDRLVKRVDTIGLVTSYNYDAEGTRNERITGTVDFRYVTDAASPNANLLQITDGTGAVRSQYVYGAAGLLERIDSTGNVLYYLFDVSHNTVALTDANGIVTDSYTYDPFGNLLKHKGANAQPFGFLGEFGVQQEQSSLYYARARYYDAETGRFLSKDSYAYNLNDPRTINRYVYGSNNPLTNFDYTGLYGQQDNQSNLDKAAPEIGDRALLLAKAILKYKQEFLTGLNDSQLDEVFQSVIESADDTYKSLQVVDLVKNLVAGQISADVFVTKATILLTPVAEEDDPVWETLKNFFDPTVAE